MRNLKVTLCSMLLLTCTATYATTDLPDEPQIPEYAPIADLPDAHAGDDIAAVVGDKRVITMTPVRGQGYVLYNMALSMLLAKDLSQIPPSLPIPPEFIEFLNSYDVENVVLPMRPTYNGTVSFDLVNTPTGLGLGHYEFNQNFSSGMVTLRVITSPVPMMPFVHEFAKAATLIAALEEEAEEQGLLK